VLLEPIFTDVFVRPLVGPVVATAGVLVLGARRRAGPVLGALLLLLPTFLLAQCLLNAVGWCLRPLANAPAVPTYLPWYAELLLTPVCYLYVLVVSHEQLQRPRVWRHLLPGLGQIGLFAGVAVLGLGYRQILVPAAGPLGPAGQLLSYVVAPLALSCYGLLVRYGLKTLEGYRRHHYLTDHYPLLATPWYWISQRTLVWLLLLGFGLGLSFVALDAWFGPLAYSELWYTFVVRGGLVLGLAIVGLQATYAAVTPTPRLAYLSGFGHLGSLPTAALLPTKLPDYGWKQPVPQTPLPLSREAAPAGLPPELGPWQPRLLAFMAAHQPWREPELTLPDLAQRLGTHASLLSKVINAGCGQNFNDFINSYRVAEAQRLLADPRYSHYSLLGVALASGFNSKSTFNRVFKKLTDQVPGDVPRPKR
jgi:AraC-like DNA-binding protein